MKTGFLDRVLVYLYVLITLILTAAVALRAFGVDLVSWMIAGLSANAPGLIWRLIVLGVCALVGILGVYVAVVITPSRSRKSNFINLSSDNGGQVRIALPAVRQMAMQAIGGIAGLQDVSIDIGEASDAVAVNVTMDVESGVHVPTVTMNMQSAIKRNIEHNCGVAVRSVTVTVKDVIPGAEAAAAEVIPANEPVEEPAKAAEEAPEYAEIAEAVETVAESTEDEAADEAPVEEEIVLAIDGEEAEAETPEA